jgi:hypothetical protein
VVARSHIIEPDLRPTEFEQHVCGGRETAPAEALKADGA